MIILQLNFERGWRGGERQIIYTMRGLLKAGVETHLLCRKGSMLEQKAIEEGFVVIGCKNVPGVIKFLSNNGSRYQFLHAHTSQILTWCVFTRYFHKSKVLFSRRVNFTQKGYFTKLKYASTDIIVAISETVKEKIAAFSGRKDIAIISDIVAKQPADQERLQRILNTIPHSGKYILGTTAALSDEKDPITLVSAFQKIASQINDVIFLHFGTGPLKEQMEKEIIACQLQQQYFLMGFEPDIDSVFSIFDVFIFSSKEEGLGSSVLDAFINKIPVVSTNAGGLKDILKENRGIVCPVGDSECLASGVVDVLSNEGVREKFIGNAYNYVNNYHSEEYITKQYINLFKNHLGEDKGHAEKI